MLLAKAQLPDEVEVEAVEVRIIVRGAKSPRSGWQDEARLMHARGGGITVVRVQQQSVG